MVQEPELGLELAESVRPGREGQILSLGNARSRLYQDRYRAGLVLGSARSAQGFSYISTSPIALVAHKKFLWKAVNRICVLQKCT